jgi:hypothetical protein
MEHNKQTTKALVKQQEFKEELSTEAAKTKTKAEKRT